MLVMTATAFAETTSEKLVEDNYALAGKVLSPKAITVDWATQKLVAVLDMTLVVTQRTSVFSLFLTTKQMLQTGSRPMVEAQCTSSIQRTQKYGPAQVWRPFIRSSLFSIAIKAMQVQQVTIRRLLILLP